MAKEIKYKITLLRFLISTFVTLFLVGCKNTYEIKENIPGSGGGTATPPPSFLRIFMTSSPVTNGNLGGTTGADAKCMADASYPGSGRYKALIADVSRSAIPDNNWVLAAEMEYRRLDDNAVIGTTTAAKIFTPPLGNPFNSGIVPMTDYAWTGLNTDWTNSANNCLNWTSDAGIQSGIIGYAGTSVTDDRTWSYSTYQCSDSYRLICVEQI